MVRREISRPLVVDAYADAELRLGRPLTLAERNIDIVGLDRDLAQGKARLHDSIEKEKRRRIKAYVRSGVDVRLRVTPDMVAALRWIYRRGVEHGRQEVATLTGTPVPVPAGEKDALDRLSGKLNDLLGPLQRKVHDKVAEAVGEALGAKRTFAADLSIGDVAIQAATRQVMNMPGALNVASQLVSSAAFNGIGDVYDENSGLFAGWMRSAVMDNATCDPCAEGDGTEYASWDEAMTEMPDGGPAVDCDGEGRCRCRLVPTTETIAGGVTQTGGAGGIIVGDVGTGQEAAAAAGLGSGRPLVSFAETTDYKAFKAAVGESARPGFLTQHTTQELKRGQAFLSEDGKAGFFLSPEGDLQNVFRNAGGVKGAGAAAVDHAVQQGARTLDAFDGFLPGLYEQAGFRVVGRMAWNDEFAPAGWDYATYGRPDVVFMAHNPTITQVRTFTDWEKAKAYSRDVSTQAKSAR